MTFAWIAAEKAEFPITRLCRTLHVSPSGFYASRARPESTHARDDRRLRVLVRASFAESKQRYGSPRVHEDLLEQHRACQPQTGRALDAGSGPAGAAPLALQGDDDERSRSAGRSQSARSRLHGGRAESTVGRRHDGVRHRRQRQALSGGDPGSVLAVHRGVGRQCATTAR